MGKKSSILRNKAVKNKIEALSEKRKRLKSILNSLLSDSSSSIKDRIRAMKKLSEFPRNSSPVRDRKMCPFTGRKRGLRIGIDRMKLRDMINRLEVPVSKK